MGANLNLDLYKSFFFLTVTRSYIFLTKNIVATSFNYAAINLCEYRLFNISLANRLFANSKHLPTAEEIKLMIIKCSQQEMIVNFSYQEICPFHAIKIIQSYSIKDILKIILLKSEHGDKT